MRLPGACSGVKAFVIPVPAVAADLVAPFRVAFVTSVAGTGSLSS